CSRPLPNLGPGCLSRRSHAGYCLPFRRLESCGFYRAAARVAAISNVPRNAAIARSDRNLDPDLRKSGGAPARQLETTARLFEHRARGLFTHWRGVFRRGRRYFLSRGLPADDALELCRSCDRIATDRRSDLRLRWIGQALAISRICHVDCNGLVGG